MPSALGSPGLWADPRQASALWTRIVPSIAAHQSDQLPDWLYLSSVGIGYAHPAEAVAARLGGTLLAATIHLASAQAGEVPALIAAVRTGLAASAADPLARPDPLPTAVEILLEAYAGALPAGTAGRYMVGLFSRTNEADRTAVLAIVLGA